MLQIGPKLHKNEKELYYSCNNSFYIYIEREREREAY